MHKSISPGRAGALVQEPLKDGYGSVMLFALNSPTPQFEMIES